MSGKSKLEDFESLYGIIAEGKDARIDRMKWLSPEQKEEMKAFFRKNPSLEGRFDWNVPERITYNAFRRLKARHLPPVNPDEVPEFSDRRDEGDGIVSYSVPDSRAGQRAVRNAVDTHWGRGANPWCLISRFGSEPEDAKPTPTYEFWKYLMDREPDLTKGDVGYAKLRGRGIDPDKRFKALAREYEKAKSVPYYEDDFDDGSEENLDSAWDYWQNYSSKPKRISFRNGKLHSFMATDFDRNNYAGLWLYAWGAKVDNNGASYTEPDGFVDDEGDVREDEEWVENCLSDTDSEEWGIPANENWLMENAVRDVCYYCYSYFPESGERSLNDVEIAVRQVCTKLRNGAEEDSTRHAVAHWLESNWKDIFDVRNNEPLLADIPDKWWDREDHPHPRATDIEESLDRFSDIDHLYKALNI